MIARVTRLWPHRHELVRAGLLNVAAGVLQGLLFVLLIPILEALLADDPDPGRAGRWLGAAAVLATGYAVVAALAKAHGFRTGNAMLRDLQHALGDHLGRLPLGWFTGDRTGPAARTVAQSAYEAAGIMTNLAPTVLATLATPLTVLVATAFVEWRLAVVFVVTAPLAVLVLRAANPVMRRATARLDASARDAAGRAVEYGQAQVVLRAAGRVQDGYERLDAAFDAQRGAYRSSLRRTRAPLLGYIAVVQAGFAAVLLVGADMALDGSVGVAHMTAVLVLATRFLEPLATLATMLGAIRNAEVALDRVESVLSTPPLPEPATSPRGLAAGPPTVTLDRVRFAYTTGRPVLDDVSLTMPAGTVTALVGPSGSGKTTVTRLIARFWDVDSGSVRLDDVDVRDLPYADLMAKIAVVFQDVYLFDGTIEDNVKLARPDADVASVRAAAAMARLDEVVERLPDGWDSRVGEGGLSLSGGERQRVSIARALLKDAPLVLLDEATAALDPETEAAVQDAIAASAAGSGKTVVVIAHRLHTVRAADQIAFLDAGRIAEVGAHEDLAAAGGRYAAFLRERGRAHNWRIGDRDRPARAH